MNVDTIKDLSALGNWAAAKDTKTGTATSGDYAEILDKTLKEAVSSVMEEKTKITRIMPDGSLMLIEVEGNDVVSHHRLKPGDAATNSGGSEAAAAYTETARAEFKASTPDLTALMFV